MSAKGRSQEQINGIAHRHYQEWFVGDGAQTEFFLQHTVFRVDDLAVTVNGLRQRPADKGTAHDFAIRGLTPGYEGDSNAVRFTAAPALNDNVCVDLVSS